MLCQIHKKTVSNSPLISNRMKKRNIFSWNLLQTISVISPPSPATPPIRGRHKSGAVPAYLDTGHTRGHPPTGHSHTALLHCASQSILELSGTVTVHQSAWRGSLKGNDAGHCCARPDQPPINCTVCTMCTVCSMCAQCALCAHVEGKNWTKVLQVDFTTSLQFLDNMRER